jgi:subtilisin family serine protease
VSLKIVAGLLITVALYVGIERIAGPSAPALPAVLPHVVRRPPPAVAGSSAALNPVNPDPEVLRLHAQGITGQGVGIAIVDSFLYTDHQEYRDRLRWYDEIDGRRGDPAVWHSAAVASIAAGRTVGVAPDADLYFVGLGMIWSNMPIGSWLAAPSRAIHAGQHQALAIRRILEMNRRLEPDRKIRVISMSIGWGPAGLRDTAAALEEARRDGIFVSTAALDAPPYGPVRIASADAPDRYTTAVAAGSWAIAYWAGRYALACQQDPSMTPARFRETTRNAR